MTCPGAEKWNALSMALVAGPEAEALLRHARACADCRRRLAEARRDHATLQRACEVFDRDHDRLREQLLAALPAAVAPPPRAVPIAAARRRLGGLAMTLTQRKTRWAALALLPAAGLVAAFAVFFASGPSVAFADVLERIRRARTMTCQTTTVSEYRPADPAGSPGRTTRTEGTLAMYADGAARAWRLDTVEPAATQWSFPDRLVVLQDGRVEVFRFHKEPQAGVIESPAQYLERMLAVCDEPDAVLGRTEIAGRPVVGFEIAGWKLGFGTRPAGPESGRPDNVARIWVDVATKLPVRLEFESAASVAGGFLHRRGVWDKLRWDVPLDPEHFEPPPASAADKFTDLDVPPVNEESFIRALEAWRAQSAELAETLDALEQQARERGDEEALGRVASLRAGLGLSHPFPPQLDVQWLMMSCAGRSAALGALDPAARRAAEQAGQAGDAGAELAAAGRAAEDIARATVREIGAPLGLFYRKLVMEGRDPEYYPAAPPGDAAAVLVRWKVDAGHARVIYADLHAETVAVGQ